MATVGDVKQDIEKYVEAEIVENANTVVFEEVVGPQESEQEIPEFMSE